MVTPVVVGAAVLVAKVTIILIAAVAITRTMQRASAGARHLVWLVALATLLVVPALTVWAPLPVRVLPARAGTVPGAARAETIVPARPVAAPASVPAVTDAAAPVPGVVGQVVGSVSAMSLIVAIWAVVMLVLVGSFTWSALVVRWIVRRARPLDAPVWRTPLLEIADRLGLDEPPRLLLSGDTKMPFACGVLRPTIVLPEECDGWSLDRRRAVLLHELAHVRRNDLLGHLLGRVVCMVYWFHPLVWMAAKRLRAESERACDDLALECGTRASDYAQHLLDIVISVQRDATPSVALAMARRREFEGRMLALLDPELGHSTPSRSQSAALIGSLALLAGIVAAVAPAPRAAIAAPVVAVAAVPVAPPVVVPRPRTIDVARPKPRPVSTPPATVIADVPHGTVDTTGDDRPALLAKVLRGDSSAELRRIAAWGLQEYADASVATDALVNAVQHDHDASVREMSAWALANAGEAQGVPAALATALRTDGNERVRATAAWALGTIGAAGSIDALTAALSDTSAHVRTHAVWALGSIQPRQAPPALLGMLRDRDAETRQLVAWALYQIRDPASLPALETALRAEPDAEIQIADIRAIAAMGEQSIDALRGLLESPDPRVKAMAVRALAGRQAMGPWPWPWPEPRPGP